MTHVTHPIFVTHLTHDPWPIDAFPALLYIHFSECTGQNSLYVQVLRSLILAVLLHGTPAAGVSQTLRRGTTNGITELCRGRHLYSAGRPSLWASAHILVSTNLPFYRCRYGLCNHSHDSNVVIFYCRCLLNLYNFDRLKIASNANKLENESSRG